MSRNIRYEGPVTGMVRMLLRAAKVRTTGGRPQMRAARSGKSARSCKMAKSGKVTVESVSDKSCEVKTYGVKATVLIV